MNMKELVRSAHYLENELVRCVNELLTPEQIQYFGTHLEETRGGLLKGLIIPPKFELHLDLGIITVPKGYDNKTQLSSFKRKYDRNLPDWNREEQPYGKFSKPSRVLIPGERLRVYAWKVIGDKIATPEECMIFLAEKKSLQVGAQGASLVYEQKRRRLIEDFEYVSFGNLCRNSDNEPMIQGLYVDPEGKVAWTLVSLTEIRGIFSFHKV